MQCYYTKKETVHNSIYGNIAEILSARFHNGDYTTLTYHDNYYAQNKKEKFQEIISYADERNLSGMVYIGGNFEKLKKSDFDKLPCPTIFVNTVLPTSFETTNYSSIMCNQFDTGKIPGKDIELISFDGLESMSYTYPSVSTYEQPKQEIADAVYNLLLGLIDNTKEHHHITFQSKLIIRESCK